MPSVLLLAAGKASSVVPPLRPSHEGLDPGRPRRCSFSSSQRPSTRYHPGPHWTRASSKSAPQSAPSPGAANSALLPPLPWSLQCPHQANSRGDSIPHRHEKMFQWNSACVSTPGVQGCDDETALVAALKPQHSLVAIADMASRPLQESTSRSESQPLIYLSRTSTLQPRSVGAAPPFSGLLPNPCLRSSPPLERLLRAQEDIRSTTSTDLAPPTNHLQRGCRRCRFHEAHYAQNCRIPWRPR
mmetsp:Transcript_42799/g.87489  ORF Transcript_42799/g.87489 Transcript_42799/m.87489 type:complete len:243 (+) Transcript_42799:259-987(+)